MEWVEIRIPCSSPLVEAITNRLFELGALGVTESGTEKDPILLAYFDKSDQSTIEKELNTYLFSIAPLFPNEKKVEFTQQDFKDTGWKDKYKEFYKAQKLSPNFFLLPAWDKATAIPEEYIPILMEPGQAFGTGLHPSTRLSIHLIEDVVKRTPIPEKLNGIDIGTGSGILAIVAEKLGINQIEAMDNDPVAVETAMENRDRNGCKRVRCSEKTLPDFQTPFDLVISNILLETHKELFGEYQRICKADGYLILSGLLGSQKSEIDALAMKHGFTFLIQRSFQEWTAFLYGRKAGT